MKTTTSLIPFLIVGIAHIASAAVPSTKGDSATPPSDDTATAVSKPHKRSENNSVSKSKAVGKPTKEAKASKPRKGGDDDLEDLKVQRAKPVKVK